eukprot:6137327-Amphidinium_carterae.1
MKEFTPVITRMPPSGSMPVKLLYLILMMRTANAFVWLFVTVKLSRNATRKAFSAIPAIDVVGGASLRTVPHSKPTHINP